MSTYQNTTNSLIGQSIGNDYFLQRTSERKLFLLSTFLFVFIVLLMQVLQTLWLFFWLKYFSVSFSASLFWIKFPELSLMKWPLLRILLVFGSGPILTLLISILLLQFKPKSWKHRLFKAWLILLSGLVLPMGILAGSYLSDGLGVVFIMLFPFLYHRLIIAFVFMLLLAFTGSFWLRLFLKSAYSSQLFIDEDQARNYLASVFIGPGVTGTIITLLFAFVHVNWYWIIYLTGLGIFIFTIRNSLIRLEKIRIHKSKDLRIFEGRKPVVIGVIALLILLGLSLYTLNF